MNHDRCKQCGAQIIWAKHHETGNPAPLDARPWESYGNIMIHDDGATYQVLDPEIVELAFERKFRLYTNHFATCPARSQGRKAS